MRDFIWIEIFYIDHVIKKWKNNTYNFEYQFLLRYSLYIKYDNAYSFLLNLLYKLLEMASNNNNNHIITNEVMWIRQLFMLLFYHQVIV